MSATLGDDALFKQLHGVCMEHMMLHGMGPEDVAKNLMALHHFIGWSYFDAASTKAVLEGELDRIDELFVGMDAEIERLAKS